MSFAAAGDAARLGPLGVGHGLSAPRAGYRVMLGLILLLGAGLRWYHVGTNPLWMDEFFTMEHVTGYGYVHGEVPRNVLLTAPPIYTQLRAARAWWHIWPAGATDNQPPLYPLLLRPWVEVFGTSAEALRGFSVLCSLVAVGLLAHTARRLHGPGVGLWAALLMAMAVPQIRHAQDARAYALLLALVLGAAAALVHVEQQGPSRGRMVALGLCLLGAGLTHYFAAGALVAMGIYAVVRLRGAGRRGALCAFGAAAMVGLAVWGPFLWAQRAHFFGANSWALTSRTDVPGRLWHLASLPLRCLAPPLSNSVAVAAGSSALFVLPFLLLKRRPDLLLWAMWLVAAAVMPALPDAARHTNLCQYIRYHLIGAPAAYALLAALLIHVRPRWLWHVLPAAGVLFCVVSVQRAYAPEWADSRVLPDLIRRHAQAGDAILLPVPSPELGWYGGYLLLTVSYYCDPLPAPVVLIERPVPPALVDELRGRRRLWMAYWSGLRNMDAWVPGAEIVSQHSLLHAGVLLELRPPTTRPATQPDAP